MLFKTRLSLYVNKISYNLKQKVLIIQKSFSLALFSLFIGFLFGNLFGTFLDTLRIYFYWNGFVGLLILLFIEIINFLVYGISINKRNNFLKKIHSNVVNMSCFLFINIKDLLLTYSMSVFTLVKKSSNLLIRRTNKGTKSPIRLTKDAKQIFDVSSSSKRLTSKICFASEGTETFGQEKKDKMVVARIATEGFAFFGSKATFCENLIYLEKSLNAFKIGLLFGFFIDSFKVGS